MILSDTENEEMYPKHHREVFGIHFFCKGNQKIQVFLEQFAGGGHKMAERETLKVYFDGNYWGHGPGQRPCRKIDVGHTFTFNGFLWRIPAVYYCGKGLVFDVCRQVPLERIRAFMEKWEKVSLDWKLMEPEASQIEYETPLDASLKMDVWVNDREILSHSGCGTVWNPLQNEKEACNGEITGAELIEAYGLEQDCGWAFYRYTLPWDYRRIPGKLILRMHLKKKSFRFLCKETFETVTGETGTAVAFTHPLDGSSHTLFIDSVTEGKIQEPPYRMKESREAQWMEKYVWPCCYQQLEYHLDENTDSNQYFVEDQGQGEQPRLKEPDENDAGSAMHVFGCAIIGGSGGGVMMGAADGGGDSGQIQKYVGSRCMFRPVGRTAWRIGTSVEQGEEKELNIRIR